MFRGVSDDKVCHWFARIDGDPVIDKKSFGSVIAVKEAQVSGAQGSFRDRIHRVIDRLVHILAVQIHCPVFARVRCRYGERILFVVVRSWLCFYRTRNHDRPRQLHSSHQRLGTSRASSFGEL